MKDFHWRMISFIVRITNLMWVVNGKKSKYLKSKLYKSKPSLRTWPSPSNSILTSGVNLTTTLTISSQMTSSMTVFLRPMLTSWQKRADSESKTQLGIHKNNPKPKPKPTSGFPSTKTSRSTFNCGKKVFESISTTVFFIETTYSTICMRVSSRTESSLSICSR